MQLKTFEYIESASTDQEWSLGPVTMNQVNLVVGKNATGKSRLINTIAGLAKYICGSQPPFILPEKGKASFTNNKIYTYEYEIDCETVLKESYLVDGMTFLSRSSDGKGVIRADKVNGGQDIDFQVDNRVFAAVMKKDSIQHPFLDPIHSWAENSKIYAFSSTMGKDRFAVFVKGDKNKQRQLGADEVVALFRRAEKQFGSQFKNAIIDDMNTLKFDIVDIGIDKPINVRIEGVAPPKIEGIFVREKSTKAVIDQVTISSGMFRCISILININYLVLSGHSGCILIDDIGEGLDFERSCLLIKLLRQRAISSKLQLIMSTNDRFVMNAVPLTDWQVLHRNGGKVKCYNIHNSKDKFEEFQFLGLSNFDLFSTDYLIS